MLRFLKVRLEAIHDDFNNSLKSAQKEAKEFEKTIKPSKQLLQDIGNVATTAGKALSVALTAPIAAVAGLGLQFNAMQEQAHIAFTTMLGDGGKARAFLEELKEFAARTPFEFPGLVKAAQRLMAMGFEAKDVRPLLEAVGNAVAGLGGGAAEIDRVTLALGQMAGRGKVATQEMNQLTEIGIPAWKALAQGFGVSEAKLRDLVEKGLVPAGKAIDILTKDMNERFGGMLDKQSKSFSGLVSTIKDESRFLAGELTEGLFNVLKGPAETVAKILGDLRMRMQGWSDSTKAAAVAAAGFAAALGPALLGIGFFSNSISSTITVVGQLTTAWRGLSLAMSGMFIGSAGIAVAGTVVIAGLVAAFIQYKNATEEVTTRLNAMKKAMDEHIPAAQKLADIAEQQAKSNGRLRIDTDALNVMMKNAREEAERSARTQKGLAEATGATSSNFKDLTINLKTGDVVMKAAAVTTHDFTDKEKEAAKAAKELAAKQKEAREELEKLWQELNRRKIERILEEIATRTRIANSEFTEWLRSVENGTAQLTNIARRLYDNIDAFGSADRFRENEERRIAIFGDSNQKLLGMAIPTGQRLAQEMSKPASEMSKAFSVALGNITSGFANAITDSIFQAKKWSDALKGVAESTAKSMLNALLVGLLEPLTKELGKLGAKLAGTLGGLLGGGGGAASAVTAAAGGATSAAGGAVSSVAGAAGGLTTGLISAAGGIIGGGLAALGSMRLEGTMNAVEFNTRATNINLREAINQIFWPMHFHLAAVRGNSDTAVAQLDAIANAIMALNVGGGGQNMEVIMTRWLEMLGVNWRGSLEDLIKLLRAASPGVVTGVA